VEHKDGWFVGRGQREILVTSEEVTDDIILHVEVESTLESGREQE